MVSGRQVEEADGAIDLWPMGELRAAVRIAAQNGYAITCNLMSFNEVSIAAPIYGVSGPADAALPVSVSAHSHHETRIAEEILPGLRDTANGMLA